MIDFCTHPGPTSSWFVLLDMKQELLWDKVQVRSPEQYERWSVLVGLVYNQLLLAREVGDADLRPWQRPQAHALTPQQVRRGMSTILSQIGTPARRCQSRRKSPGFTQEYCLL